jgi:hypothetical protein
LEALVAGTASTRSNALAQATMSDLLQNEEETLSLIPAAASDSQA